MLERIKLTCKTCGHEHFVTVDSSNVNPKKIRLEACMFCPLELKKKKFGEISKHSMKATKIKVKEIPGLEVIAEAKPVKSKKYGEQI
jgi:ribosomal protein L33